MTTKSKEPNFEEALEHLETIVENLEGGEMGLDQALKLYEEGISTAQACMKRLEEAKKRIQILTRNSKGELNLEDVKSKSKASKKKN